MQRLAILGSTGSIGLQTLDVVEAHPDLFEIVALTADKNIGLLKNQAEKFNAKLIGVADEKKGQGLKQQLGNIVVTGAEANIAACSLPEVDIVIIAIVGIAALKPLLAAIANHKKIACANKESLVCGGELVLRECQKHGVQIYPVDSEHSAIFQCLQATKQEDINKLLLTCSGGPFRTLGKDQLGNVTLKQALRHPTWNMGKKITIDSASLANKGLEVIEARYLFGIAPNRIEVIIHPESIVHSMVELNDGSILAQLSGHDMRLAIQYALTYPSHVNCPVDRLNFEKIHQLTFALPDLERFPALALAYEALKIGGDACIIYNGANEEAVGLFLKEKIRFTDIPKCIEVALKYCSASVVSSLEDIIAADQNARERVRSVVNV